MMIVIQVAANGVLIKQDNSDDCHVFQNPKRAPHAAAKKVKEILSDHFADAEEEGGDSGAED